MARRMKGVAVDAPQTRVEAISLAARYVANERLKQRQLLTIDAEIDALMAKRTKLIADCDATQAAFFPRLKAWWAVQGSAEVAPKKSVELSGLTLGERTGNPSLKLPKGVVAAAAIAVLKAAGKAGFVRVKEELDRAAIIAALRWQMPKDEMATNQNSEELDRRFSAQLNQDWLTGQGYTVVQGESFYIDVAPPEPVKIEEEVI